MRIERVEIKGFGKIRGMVLNLGSGLNVIFGPNEAGKSTIQRFIRAMLYGLRSGRQSSAGLPADNKRFMPWDGLPYGGSIFYTLDDGSSFRVERDFSENTVQIYDSNYDDITATFRLGRDKLPMFANEHLEMDEATFIRTSFISQMGLVISNRGLSELAARLANVNDTGLEGLSFQKAEAALTDALKSRIGTSRSRTQPLDKLEARLKQLGAEHTRLAARQEQRLTLKEELVGVKSRLKCLEEQECYLGKVRVLVDTRKKIDAGIKREANLRDIVAMLEEADQRQAYAQEQRSRVTRETDLNEGINGRAGAGVVGIPSGPSHSLAFLVTCFIVALISGALFIYSFISRGQEEISLLSYLYGLSMLIFVVAGILLMTKRFKAISRISQDKLNDVTDAFSAGCSKTEDASKLDNTGTALKTVDSTPWERVDGLALLRENAFKSASLICGNKLDSVEDVRNSVKVAQNDLEELSHELQQGLEETVSLQSGDSYFTRRDFDVIIYDTDIASLESELRTEREIVKEKILQCALREQYCEGMLDDDRESDDELQRLEEETVAVKEKITYLRNKGKAIKLAHEVLLEAGMEIRSDFAPELNNRMSSIIVGLTDQRYVDLRGDGQLLLRASEPQNGEVKRVHLLSGGTVDQMYLAMRLAMTDLLTSHSERLPLIMDEVFSQFDDNRTALGLKYLQKEYRENQIFIFTCKHREVELAKQIFGDKMNLVELKNGDY